MRYIVIACLLCLPFLAGAPKLARAATAQDCWNLTDPAGMVRACTKMARQFRHSRHRQKAYIYAFRSYGYMALREYDRALEDVKTSLSMRKDMSLAYFVRGKILYERGQYEEALESLNQTLKVKPLLISRLGAHLMKAKIFAKRGQREEAIQEVEALIRLKPNDGTVYWTKADYHWEVFEQDLALNEMNEAIRLDANNVGFLAFRANIRLRMGRYQKAMEDIKKAIAQIKRKTRRGGKKRKKTPEFEATYATSARLNYLLGNKNQAWSDIEEARTFAESRGGQAYVTRALLNIYEGNYKLAEKDLRWIIKRADNERCKCDWREANFLMGMAKVRQSEYQAALPYLDKAVGSRRLFPQARAWRGYAKAKLNQYESAHDDLSISISTYPNYVFSYYFRGYLREKMGDKLNAMRDYRAGLYTRQSQFVHGVLAEESRQNLAVLMGGAKATDKSRKTASETKVEAPERRIALVIGNSKYNNTTALKNPANDAKAVAQKFRRLGFSEVIEVYDLGYKSLRDTLKRFGDKAITADWAVIYFAGHGVQVDGVNYLLPTDAKLLRATHVSDEAVSLDRVLSKVSDAKKLRMVILDACRNNPFASRMQANGRRTRSVGKGLAPIEPESGTLVAFAARDGQVALDGASNHSPFTRAFLAHLEEKNLEIQLLFRKVRDTVLTQTGRQQEPHVYGSLPGVEMYFRK